MYLNGEPLAQIDAGSPETILYLHTDHLLTARYATNAAGSTVWSWDSGAFGKEAPTGSATVNLRFPGQYYDAETGLHYNWHRYYDPVTGRYITSDPLGLAAGLNTYGYAGQNPLSFVDRDGQHPVLVALGIAITIYAIYDTVVAINDYANGRLLWPELRCRLLWNWGLPAAVGAFRLFRAAGAWLRGLGSVGDDVARALGGADDITRVAGIGDDIARFGKPQVTRAAGRETTHASTSVRLGDKAAASEKAIRSIHYNQRLSTVTGGRIASRKQPDVTIVYEDGTIRIIEVLSPGQTRAGQTEKYLNDPEVRKFIGDIIKGIESFNPDPIL